MEWIEGKWADKPAHWYYLNPYVTVVVRQKDYSPESGWTVKIHVGDMSELVGTFAHEELEAAKESGLRAGQKFMAELAA